MAERVRGPWFLFNEKRRTTLGEFGGVTEAKRKADSYKGKVVGWTLEVTQRGDQPCHEYRGGPGGAFLITNQPPEWTRENGPRVRTKAEAAGSRKVVGHSEAECTTVSGKTLKSRRTAPRRIVQARIDRILAALPQTIFVQEIGFEAPLEPATVRDLLTVNTDNSGAVEETLVVALEALAGGVATTRTDTHILSVTRQNEALPANITTTEIAIVDREEALRSNPSGARRNDVAPPKAVAPAVEPTPTKPERRTPVVLQHAALQIYRGLRKKVTDPKERRSRAFAIATASLQDAGVFAPGSRRLTRYGRRIEREHEREDPEVLAKKLRAYERMLRAGTFDAGGPPASQETRHNPTKLPRPGDHVEFQANPVSMQMYHTQGQLYAPPNGARGVVVQVSGPALVAVDFGAAGRFNIHTRDLKIMSRAGRSRRNSSYDRASVRLRTPSTLNAAETAVALCFLQQHEGEPIGPSFVVGQHVKYNGENWAIYDVADEDESFALLAPDGKRLVTGIQARDFQPVVWQARRRPNSAKKRKPRARTAAYEWFVVCHVGDIPSMPAGSWNEPMTQPFEVLTLPNGGVQYVIVESGWEFKEDAQDRLRDLREENRPGLSTATVSARRTLTRLGVDPDKATRRAASQLAEMKRLVQRSTRPNPRSNVGARVREAERKAADFRAHGAHAQAQHLEVEAAMFRARARQNPASNARPRVLPTGLDLKRDPYIEMGQQVLASGHAPHGWYPSDATTQSIVQLHRKIFPDRWSTSRANPKKPRQATDTDRLPRLISKSSARGTPRLTHGELEALWEAGWETAHLWYLQHERNAERKPLRPKADEFFVTWPGAKGLHEGQRQFWEKLETFAEGVEAFFAERREQQRGNPAPRLKPYHVVRDLSGKGWVGRAHLLHFPAGYGAHKYVVVSEGRGEEVALFPSNARGAANQGAPLHVDRGSRSIEETMRRLGYVRDTGLLREGFARVKAGLGRNNPTPRSNGNAWINLHPDFATEAQHYWFGQGDPLYAVISRYFANLWCWDVSGTRTLIQASAEEVSRLREVAQEIVSGDDASEAGATAAYEVVYENALRDIGEGPERRR